MQSELIDHENGGCGGIYSQLLWTQEERRMQFIWLCTFLIIKLNKASVSLNIVLHKYDIPLTQHPEFVSLNGFTIKNDV